MTTPSAPPTGAPCPECYRTIRIDDGKLARHPDRTFNHTCPGTGTQAPTTPQENPTNG